MKILFVHANFPGQYRYLAVRLAQDPTNTVVAIMDERNDVAGREQFGIQVHKYKLAKVVAKAIHPYVAEFDDGVRRGQQVARICVGLRQKGFIPEVICVHPGWGSALYLKDVYPESRVLTYCESYNPAPRSLISILTPSIREASTLCCMAALGTPSIFSAWTVATGA